MNYDRYYVNLDQMLTEIENIKAIKERISEAKKGNDLKQVDILNRLLSKRITLRLATDLAIIYKEHKIYKYFEDNFKQIAKGNSYFGKKVKTFDEAKKLICKIDFRPFFNLTYDLRESFQSFFYYRELGIFYSAYINSIKVEDTNGRKYVAYKMFIETDKRSIIGTDKIEEFEISLNLIDIYRAMFKKNYYEAMEELATMLGIDINNKDTKYRREQKVKFANNILLLSNIADMYSNVSQLIDRNIFVLKEMNLKAIESTLTSKESYNKQAVFFCSTRHMEARLKEVAEQIIEEEQKIKTLSYNYIARLFILYRVLGLLVVVNPENVPQRMINLMPQKADKDYYDTYFYIIPEYDSITFAKAERIAKKLIKGGITLENISRIEIEKVMGKEFSQKIYSASVRRYQNALLKPNKNKVKFEKTKDEEMNVIFRKDEKENEVSNISFVNEEEFTDMPF
ncbi:hypothetical protein [Clostridium beijerinckii]|uniref:hypothetical protein n=1 Tax=Clostridium beijerinckii TaxID=1520 RepID=UPI0013615377|nr:hypothetical protein [Clostridium beijerinckii]MZK49028.1 hypothetical protein [Clostridium beijerinckii]MZK57403.1 hypothetical protein [Clostridium beijerinckii]MZK67614.1 hypothetical protein [Clostridium beijerinckii]MZK72699.1 hypothetical protein [Clostridium beijerinckii]MZK82295.1 hypothetical protein [Clostridium beijerinckii]